MLAMQIFYLFIVVLIATNMLPMGAKPKHFFLPVVFSSACFLAMRGGAFQQEWTLLDGVIIGSVIAGFVVKAYVEAKQPS